MELNAEQVISKLRENDSCYAEDIKAIQNAIALITSQEQRIKELTEETAAWKEIAEGYQKQFEDCAEDRAKLTEENERLREDNEIKSQKRANIFEIANAYERGQADTVRKLLDIMAENATNGYPRKVRLDVVERKAKEMLEGACAGE